MFHDITVHLILDSWQTRWEHWMKGFPPLPPWLGDFVFTGWNTSHRSQILLPNYICTARSYLTIR